ncbi:MAG: Oxygen regulatory protein NreC [Bacteroidota bacterium]
MNRTTPNQKIKIALVEDHFVVRKGICAMLSTIPELDLVFDAANGQEFLDQIKEKEIDVVLLDLDMPIMNGIQTVKELKEMWSTIKIVMLTMHDDYEIAFDVLNDGVDAYLLKECTLDEMLDAIQKVHENVEYSNAFMKDTLIHNLAENRKNSFKMGLLKLSERDIKILKLICDGKTSFYISEYVSTSKKNIDLIRSKLLTKFNVSSANELIRVAILNGFYKPRTNSEIEQEHIEDINAKTDRRLNKLRQNNSNKMKNQD